MKWHNRFDRGCVGAILLASTILVAAIAVASCGGLTTRSTDEHVATTTQAAVSTPGLTSTNLELKVSENACYPNGAQEYFQVTNNSAAPVPLSSLQIKYWVYDTSGTALQGQMWNGGCVTSSNGTCLHTVSGVTVTTTPFAPACGASSTQQANWEVTVSTTDSTPLAPGQTWGDVQTAINLANFANFTPGSATWFSPCGSLQPFQTNPNFGLYISGDLVDTLGITAPSCRAPHGTDVLSGYLTPASVSAPVVGPVPPDTPMLLTIGLPVPNTAALQAFIQTVSDPASPEYGQYLTPQAFGATFGSPDYSALVAWAQSTGLAVTTFPNDLEVTVRGTAAAVGQALYVNLVNAKRPDGTLFFAPDRQPSLNLTSGAGAIAVQGIEGTNNYVRPTSATPHAQSTTAAEQPQQGSTGVPFGTGRFGSSDFRNAYLSPAPGQPDGGVDDCRRFLGDGQTVALVEFDGFFPSDIVAYAQQEGLTEISPSSAPWRTTWRSWGSRARAEATTAGRAWMAAF